MRDFSRVLTRDARSEAARERHLSEDPSLRWPDLDEQLRGALRRMASTAEGMGALPVEGCGFTVAVEMDGEGVAPLGVSTSSVTFLGCVWLMLTCLAVASAGVDSVGAELAAEGRGEGGGWGGSWRGEDAAGPDG